MDRKDGENHDQTRSRQDLPNRAPQMIARWLKQRLLLVWRLPIPEALRAVAMWLINARFLVTVAALTLNEQGELLLFKHTYRRRYPWGLPGGWMKHGESPDEGIEREVAEETGYQLRVLRPLLIDSGRRFPRIDILYLAELEGGSFRPSLEVIEACFFPVDALPELTKDTRRVIQRAFRELDLRTKKQKGLK